MRLLSVVLASALAASAARAQPIAGHSPAAAAAQAALTLGQAVDLALQRNPDLAGVRREADAAAALRQQAGILPNPSLSYDRESTQDGRRASGVVLSQPIELGGRRAARIRAAEQGGQVAQAEIGLRAAEVRAAAIERFFETVVAQEREQLARGSVELARRVLDVASRRVLAGRVSPVEQTRAQVAESSSRVELSQAQTELANARMRLAALWGEAAPPFALVDGGLDRLPAALAADELAARAAAAPEAVRARAEIERREAAAALARTLRTPTLAVSAGTRTLIETGQRAALVGLSVDIPVFDRNQGNVREAVVRTEQARDRLAAAEHRVRTEALAANARLAAARQQAELVRTEILPGATGALDAATRGYELGRFGFLDVLDAQRTVLAARGQLVRAAADALRAAAEIERLLGTAPSLVSEPGTAAPAAPP